MMFITGAVIGMSFVEITEVNNRKILLHGKSRCCRTAVQAHYISVSRIMNEEQRRGMQAASPHDSARMHLRTRSDYRTAPLVRVQAFVLSRWRRLPDTLPPGLCYMLPLRDALGSTGEHYSLRRQDFIARHPGPCVSVTRGRVSVTRSAHAPHDLTISGTPATPWHFSSGAARRSLAPSRGQLLRAWPRATPRITTRFDL